MIAELARRLVAVGVDPGEAASIVAEAFALGAASVRVEIPRNSADENRRARDRERKRLSREFHGIPRKSADSADTHIIQEVSKKDSIRAQRLSADIAFPPDWRSWAVSNGLSEQEADAQFDRFKDYWIAKPGKDGASPNWLARWRNWCREFLTRKGRAPTTGPPAITAEAREILRKTEEFKAERERRKLNGQAPSTPAVDGSGTEGPDHQGELLPPR